MFGLRSIHHLVIYANTDGDGKYKRPNIPQNAECSPSGWKATEAESFVPKFILKAWLEHIRYGQNQVHTVRRAERMQPHGQRDVHFTLSLKHSIDKQVAFHCQIDNGIRHKAKYAVEYPAENSRRVTHLFSRHCSCGNINVHHEGFTNAQRAGLYWEQLVILFHLFNI